MRPIKALLSMVAMSSGCFLASREAPDLDANTVLPVLFDYRAWKDTNDVSGLVVGSHALEFDAYISTEFGMKWDAAIDEILRQGIRIGHVKTQTRARTRISLKEIPGRLGVRHVTVEADLDAEGLWAFVIADARLFPLVILKGYDILDQTGLHTGTDSPPLLAGNLLRYVGRCPHPTKAVWVDGSRGELRVVLSESVDVARDEVRAQSGEVSLAVRGGPVSSLEIATTGADAAEVISLSAKTLAGSFAANLNCSPAPVVIEHYAEAIEMQGMILFSPFTRAEFAAFPAPK